MNAQIPAVWMLLSVFLALVGVIAAEARPFGQFKALAMMTLTIFTGYMVYLAIGLDLEVKPAAIGGYVSFVFWIHPIIVAIAAYRFSKHLISFV